MLLNGAQADTPAADTLKQMAEVHSPAQINADTTLPV